MPLLRQHNGPQSLLGRLEAIPTFLAGARRSIREGVPAPWRAKCLHECSGTTQLLQKGVATWLAAEGLDEPRILGACETASAAVEEYRRWLTDDVADTPPQRLAIGEAFFDLLLSRGHHCADAAAALRAEATIVLDDALAGLDRRARLAAPAGIRKCRPVSPTHMLT